MPDFSTGGASALNQFGINNPNNPIIPGGTGGPKKQDPFQLAADVQSAAQTGGAAAEVGGINDAIAQLQALLGGQPQFTGFDPFADAGTQALSGIQQGSSIGGFGDRLNQIIQGDAFGGLVEERNRNSLNQLGSVGLSRSGVNVDQANAIPTDLAFALENQLFNREAGIAGLGLQATGGQANVFNQQTGQGNDITQQIAQLLGLAGAAEGGGIRGAGEAQAGGILGEQGFQFQQDQIRNQNQSNTFGLLGAGIGGALGGPFGGAIGAGVGGLFSDPRLKENVRLEGKIGPLDLVRWDWIPEVKGTIVAKCKTIGFMSTQVKEHFPDLVSEFGGFDVINYHGLMERLDA